MNQIFPDLESPNRFIQKLKRQHAEVFALVVARAVEKHIRSPANKQPPYDG